MPLVDFGKRLLECAKQGETEEVRVLMSNGAPFTTDWLGASPLHMAAENGHEDTAELLLRAGISRDARTKVDRTPLHVAAQEGHLAVTELLIKHGADVNAQDMLLMTPLHWAVEHDHIDVITCLLKHNAIVKIHNKFGKTAMDIAVDNGKLPVQKILQESKKVLQFRNKFSETGPQKHRFILPKPVTLPLLTNKADPIATSCMKEVTIKGVIQTSSDVTASNTLVKSAGLRTSPLHHPISFEQNLSKNTAGPKSSYSDSDEGETTEQSCTSMLATLAALAEAAAPNATISTPEAVQLLKKHGIAMLPSDDSTTVATALEGGQAVSLTEAGKLALTWIKEQKFGSSS